MSIHVLVIIGFDLKPFATAFTEGSEANAAYEACREDRRVSRARLYSNAIAARSFDNPNPALETAEGECPVPECVAALLDARTLELQSSFLAVQEELKNEKATREQLEAKSARDEARIAELVARGEPVAVTLVSDQPLAGLGEGVALTAPADSTAAPPKGKPVAKSK